MNYSDEDLQNRVENGTDSSGSPDEKAYQKIFGVLNREPYHLPANFADKVIVLAEAKRHSLFKEYFWFGLGLFSFVLAAVLVIVMTNFRFHFSSFKFVSGYWGLIAFVAAFILLIQIIDKQLVKNKLSA